MRSSPGRALVIVIVILVAVAAAVLAYLYYQERQQAEEAARLVPATVVTPRPSPGSPMASVGGVDVTYADFDQEWRDLARDLEKPLSCLELVPVKYAVLMDLVHRAAADLEKRDRGIEVSDDDVEEVAMGLAQAEIAQLYPTEEALQKHLLDIGLTVDEFIEKTAHDLLKEREAIEDEAELRALMEDVTKDVTLAADKLEDEFMAVKIRRITINTGATEPGKPNLTSLQAKAKIDSVYEELGQGRDFADLAKEHSDHAESAKQGGAFTGPDGSEYIPRRTFGPEFDNAAFNTEVGDYSKPFETDTGWHIILVEDRKAQLPADFARRRDEYREDLEQDMKIAHFRNWWDGLPRALGFDVHDPELKAFGIQAGHLKPEEAEGGQEVRTPHDQILALYDQALELYPDDRAAVLHCKVLCYEEMSDRVRADELIREVQALEGTLEVHDAYGDLYRLRDDSASALECYDQAADLIAEREPEEQAMWHGKWAEALALMGETERAAEHRKRLEELEADLAQGEGPREKAGEEDRAAGSRAGGFDDRDSERGTKTREDERAKTPDDREAHPERPSKTPTKGARPVPGAATGRPSPKGPAHPAAETRPETSTTEPGRPAGPGPTGATPAPPGIKFPGNPHAAGG